MSTARNRSQTSEGFVTWGMLDRVLELALGPIKETLDEVHADVRALRAEKSERDGAAKERHRWIDSRRFVITAGIALIGALLASIATLVWLAVGG